MLQYPLSLSFKIVSFGGRIYVSDASGAIILYVKQKHFKLKESIEVYSSDDESELLYHIKADRIIDWSAKYEFTTADGAVLGHIQRQGMKSLWKARYDIEREGQELAHIQELNGWVKVIDGLFGEIPILGMFSGYLFHPAYAVTSPDGTEIMRVEKQPAFFEGKFIVQQMQAIAPNDEMPLVLGIMMMALLERRRG